MKFILPLGSRIGRKDPDASNTLLGVVHGPYEDDRAVLDALGRLRSGDRSRQFLVIEGTVVCAEPSLRVTPDEGENILSRSAPGPAEVAAIDAGARCDALRVLPSELR